MEKSQDLTYMQGVLAGLPIGLAYLAVSFTFGLASTQAGLPIWLSTVISGTNLTSAGQFAAMSCIAVMGSLAEIALVTLTINMRYVLMSLSLAQQLGIRVNTAERLFMSCFITDEIFALATLKGEKLNFKYFIGIATLPYIGWTTGTLLGGLITQLLPESLQSAMGIALYCMFIAIIIPPCKKSKAITFCVGISIVFTCLFYYTSGLKNLSSGFRVIICSVIAACICAIVFPVNQEKGEKITKEDMEENMSLEKNVKEDETIC